MKFLIQNGTLTIYGVPTLAQLKVLVNSLDEQHDHYKVVMEVISPDEKKELAILPLLQILADRVQEGFIRQESADQVTQYLKSLSLEDIEKLNQQNQTGTLNF
ncbi:MAG TPA: hypothetical protein VIQ31_32145 [Phormidium sp.]